MSTYRMDPPWIGVACMLAFWFTALPALWAAFKAMA